MCHIGYARILIKNLTIAFLKMPTLKISKREVDALPFPAKGQDLYFDTELKGFGIRVSQRTKTYIAQRDIHGRTVRVTLGRHGVLTPESARREALPALAEMGAGKNPNQIKKAERCRPAFGT